MIWCLLGCCSSALNNLLIIFSTFSLWLHRARGSALGISWALRTRRASSQPRSVCTPSPPLLWEMIRPPRLCLCVPRSNHMKSIEPVMNPSWICHISTIPDPLCVLVTVAWCCLCTDCTVCECVNSILFSYFSLHVSWPSVASVLFCCVWDSWHWQSLAGVKRVVELDGKFSNRAKGEDKPDKAGTAFPDNEVYRGVCSNHICEA